MNLRDDIRNYNVTSALPTELIKTSIEYEALAVLKYSFPEQFSKLHKAEAPEEIAYINGFIEREQLYVSAQAYGKSPYGEHLMAVAEGRVRY